MLRHCYYSYTTLRFGFIQRHIATGGTVPVFYHVLRGLPLYCLVIMGVRRNFSRWATSTFRLSFSGCERCSANGPSQNALLFLHHKENSPLKHVLCLHFFEIVFRWSCIRVCENIVLFVILYSFFWIGVLSNISIIVTCRSWIGFELPTTAFSMLTLVCVGGTSLIKI